MISELLTIIGIKRPVILHSLHLKEGVQGVTIANIPDLKQFCESIHSVIPEKEKVLDTFRQRILEDARIAIQSEDQLISEWRTIYTLLGHIPNSSEINELRMQGKTKWGASAYADRLGKTESGRSYLKAVKYLSAILGLSVDLTNKKLPYRHSGIPRKRSNSQIPLIEDYIKARETCLKKRGRLPTAADMEELRRKGDIGYSRVQLANRFGRGSYYAARDNLEKIIFSDDINSELKNYEEKTGFQIRYTSKTHRFDDERAIKSLKRLSILLDCIDIFPNVLVDNYGKPLYLRII